MDKSLKAMFERKLQHIKLGRLAELGVSPNWWQDLLRAWAPSGSASTEHRFLRLAVRKNYLNFYRQGQSVAKVGFAKDGTPWLSTHIKYLWSNANGQGYVRLVDRKAEWTTEGSTHLVDYAGRATLYAWATQATHYAGYPMATSSMSMRPAWWISFTPASGVAAAASLMTSGRHYERTEKEGDTKEVKRHKSTQRCNYHDAAWAPLAAALHAEVPRAPWRVLMPARSATRQTGSPAYALADEPMRLGATDSQSAVADFKSLVHPKFDDGTEREVYVCGWVSAAATAKEFRPFYYSSSGPSGYIVNAKGEGMEALKSAGCSGSLGL